MARSSSAKPRLLSFEPEIPPFLAGFEPPTFHSGTHSQRSGISHIFSFDLFSNISIHLNPPSAVNLPCSIVTILEGETQKNLKLLEWNSAKHLHEVPVVTSEPVPLESPRVAITRRWHLPSFGAGLAVDPEEGNGDTSSPRLWAPNPLRTATAGTEPIARPPWLVDLPVPGCFVASRLKWEAAFSYCLRSDGTVSQLLIMTLLLTNFSNFYHHGS